MNTNPFSPPRSTVSLVRACASAFRINEKVSIISGRTERSPHHLSTPKVRCFSITHFKSRQQRCAYLIRLEQQKHPTTSLCYSLTVLYPYTLPVLVMTSFTCRREIPRASSECPVTYNLITWSIAAVIKQEIQPGHCTLQSAEASYSQVLLTQKKFKHKNI